MPDPNVETLLREWGEFRQRQDTRNEEITRWGTATQETQNAVEEIRSSLVEQGARYEEQFRALENRLNRPGTGGNGGGVSDQELRQRYASWDSMRTGRRVTPEAVKVEDIQRYSEAFRAYVQGGRGSLTSEQLQVLNQMSSGSNPDGGYLVEPEMDNAIMEMIVETSPIRRRAGQRTITTKTIGGRRRIGRASAAWVFETQARTTTTTPQVGMWKIDAHELYAMPEDTQENLEDASMDVEGWLRGQVSDEFAYAENTAFVNGTGVGQPRGLLTYTAGTPSESNWDVIEQVNSGAAAALTADGLINLIGALKTEYLDGASFGMRRATMTAAMELKDGTGNYLLRPDFSNGVAWRILGFPVDEWPDMPAIGANNLAIVFGNLRRGYLIVDRRDTTLLVDPYTNKPFIRFYMTKRVGGDVVQPEAIKIQKIAA